MLPYIDRCRCRLMVPMGHYQSVTSPPPMICYHLRVTGHTWPRNASRRRWAAISEAADNTLLHKRFYRQPPATSPLEIN